MSLKVVFLYFLKVLDKVKRPFLSAMAPRAQDSYFMRRLL